jgi:3'-phosphoadenosine 5'-phosphosulfate sulfotransferase (PAPS reductase)/FAD synthetase
MLKPKTRNQQKDWYQAWQTATDMVSYNRIQEITTEALGWLHKSTKGQKVAYGWSGGKDSLVLQKLCETVGIKDAVLCITDLEYNPFLEHVSKTKPSYCQVWKNKRLNLAWLNKNPDMLFPTEQSTTQKYFKLIQQKGCREYFFANQLDQMVIGRRKADGNYCPNRQYTIKSGYTQNLPIMDWSHEELFAFMQYNNIPLPAFYLWEDGFKVGTGTWSKMRRNEDRPTMNDCWAYVYRYDPETVIHASRVLESAKQFIKGL